MNKPSLDAVASEFTQLPLKSALFQGLEALGHVHMTPVQAQSLPALLAGRDLIAQAPTGSGKTDAFGLAVLQRVDVTRVATQALVLCPTRELASQVSTHVRTLATGTANLKLLTLTGGMPLGPQLASLTHAPHVVVGTPGRVQDLLCREALDLSNVTVLVLDEADRMLDMGFEPAIRAIVGLTPPRRQMLMFSATYADGIRAIADGLLCDPATITVASDVVRAAIEQHFFEVDAEQKPAALAGLLLTYEPASAVVFCNMRRDVDSVAVELARLGFAALALHGDMAQRNRDEVLLRFANHSCTVLVASDVAARGLDIAALDAVINYDLPGDAQTYVHRTGRTGRAGRSGLALTLCLPRQQERAARLEQALSEQGQPSPLHWDSVPQSNPQTVPVPAAPMATLRINAGRKHKLRPGDIVGAITGDAGLPGAVIGKIDVFATRSYVAIRRDWVNKARARLQAGRIKGRHFRVRRL